MRVNRAEGNIDQGAKRTHTKKKFEYEQIQSDNLSRISDSFHSSISLLRDHAVLNRWVTRLGRGKDKEKGEKCKVKGFYSGFSLSFHFVFNSFYPHSNWQPLTF